MVVLEGCLLRYGCMKTQGPRRYAFTEQIWLYPGETASWHFVTLPKEVARDIRERFGNRKRGFGSIPVMATIGATAWRTSIFPDKREDSYLLPIKADVRRKEGVGARDLVPVTLSIG